MYKLSRALSERVFTIRNGAELKELLAEISKEIGGITRLPLGGISNNVHTVEVAADPALALVERPINAIDAMLELEATRRNDTAQTPHEASTKWYGVPAAGLTGIKDQKLRRRMAENISVTMHESETGSAPSISIQDRGIGVHPDDFPKTVLSLLGENKKMKRHVMGVYNAGGAASFKFSSGAIIASRLEPSLLGTRKDEIGLSIVMYNPLDVSAYKTGTYEYVAAKDGSIIRLDLPEMPNGFGYGTYVMLLEYQMRRWAAKAHGPTKSLWQLFHTSLPNPPLPFLIAETRKKVLGKEKETDRVIMGLQHQLSDDSVAKYRDERTLDLGTDIGTVTLRYYVLNPTQKDLDYYVKAEQGLTLTLNGQRQHAKPRLWLKAQTDLHFLYKRLIVIVDCTGVTGAARRLLFPSTREMAADTEVTRAILDRVVRELREDDDLYDLDEAARDSALSQSTKTTTDKVKKQLASQVSAVIQGTMEGKKGGKPVAPKPPRPPRPPRPRRPPRDFDDSQFAEIPDTIEILNSPLRIKRGGSASLRLAINAKNGFIPEKFNDLKFVFAPELKPHITVGAKGRLLGGVMRVTLEATAEAPIQTFEFTVDMTSEDLGISEKAKGQIAILLPKETEEENDDSKGGEPDVDIEFVNRDAWSEFGFDSEAVGVCNIKRNEKGDIIAVEWILNADFEPFETTRKIKKLAGNAEEMYRDRYGYAVAMGLFNQELSRTALVYPKRTSAEDADEDRAHENAVSDSYAKVERARWARAVLIALDPDITLSQQAEEGSEDGDTSEEAETVGVGAD